MPAQLDPQFLVAWVRAELTAAGDVEWLDGLIARAKLEDLDDDEAELDASGQLAERRGLLDALERAAGEVWLLEVREARGGVEKLERGSHGAVAFLAARPGAVDRLAQLAQALLAAPGTTVAELEPVLGGSPGCSVR